MSKKFIRPREEWNMAALYGTVGLLVAVGLIYIFVPSSDPIASKSVKEEDETVFTAGEYENSKTSKESWRSLCNSASSVTKMFNLGSTRHFRLDAAYLLENNGPSDISFYWEDSVKYPHYETHECTARININGVYNGTTVNETEGVRVNSFIVDNEGNVSAHGVGERE